jgi:hypothetical protein
MENTIAHIRLAYYPDVFVYGLEMALGAGLLILWYAARGSRVLLWFSLLIVLWAANTMCELLTFFWRLDWPMSADWAASFLTSVPLNVAVFEFIDAAFETPQWMVRTLEAIGIIWPVLLFLPGCVDTPSVAHKAAAQLGFHLFGVWVAGQSLLAFWLLLRGRRETRGLAAAASAWGLVVFLDDYLYIVPHYFEWRGSMLGTDTVTLFLVFIAMSWLLLRRMWKDWREKEDLRAEYDAASAMQSRLVPRDVEIPGFRVESAYHPARLVGGDFFRFLPADSGSVLVVVGDVSGKGLAAAMTVASIAGALDNEFSRNPGKVLEHLNRALLLRQGEGFVTCCAALLSLAGEVVVANAGHLAPYKDGIELPVEPELPLGIVAGASYAESRFHLDGAHGLTFLSDGVVEATNTQGQLLGFDRTRDISTRSAPEIAEAARAWGQNDDITVVTVRRMT